MNPTAHPLLPLRSGIRSRTIEGINGLRMQVLEAGFEGKGRPCVLLLHGFPELAFSWRKVMPALADAGYHVLAPDQRGYGRTTGWEADFDGDLAPFKSADWKGNQPCPLKSWSAGELARLPTYYVMDLAKTMPETVAEEMPSKQAIAANAWLPDDELAVYSAEYQRTGFQGGLQWYRCGTSNRFTAELETWSGRSIDVPSCFISGRQDWGTYQRPSVFETMQTTACTRMFGAHLVDSAGHWVQQEQPDEVSRLLLEFLKSAAAPPVR